MRISFPRTPHELINEPVSWWHEPMTELTEFTKEFQDWLAMSDIEVRVTANGAHLEAYWNAANDEKSPDIIHFDFAREQDALAFKMRWL